LLGCLLDSGSQHAARLRLWLGWPACSRPPLEGLLISPVSPLQVLQGWWSSSCVLIRSLQAVAAGRCGQPGEASLGSLLPQLCGASLVVQLLS
jgi:hypothetical protein